MAKKIAELDEEVLPVDSADEDEFDEDEDLEDEDEEDYDDEDQEDEDVYDASAVLEEVNEAEQAHADAVQEYAQVVADINQQQIKRIQALKTNGFTAADVAKVYPRKLVVEAFASAATPAQ